MLHCILPSTLDILVILKTFFYRDFPNLEFLAFEYRLNMEVTNSKHGGKRPRRGRALLSPNSFEKAQARRKLYLEKWRSNHRRISLEKTVYKTWQNLKETCNYSSDTAFAKHLLSLELRRQEL